MKTMKTTIGRGSLRRSLFFCVGFITLTLVAVACTKEKSEEENTLNLVISSNVKGLDPIDVSDVYSSRVTSQIFEGLLSYHYLKRPLEIIPQLAASMPTVSADGLVHTFKLKKGVKFQDDPCFPEGKGREITSNDFVYSWRRLADPRNRSEGFWVFDGHIKGLNEWRTAVGEGKADYSTPIEGLQTPDSETLIIKLTHPYFQLHYVLAMVVTAVVPKEAVEKYDKEILNHPVGTGPFRLESWVRNNKIVLVKNPSWTGQTYPTEGEPDDRAQGLLEDAGKPLPFADKVVMTELVEDQPRWLNFLKGNFDYAGIPKDNFDQAISGGALSEELKQKGMRLHVAQYPDLTYVAFNMEDPVLGKNKTLRKALSMATNTQISIEKFYNNRAIPAHSPVPPGIDGYDKDFVNPYQKYDLVKAKELMKEAGFPEGKGLPEFTFETTNSATARQVAEYFKQEMAALGVQIRIGVNTWPEFTTKVKEKRAQIWGIAWNADYPDSQNFYQLLYGKNVSPGPNGSNYVNKEFDELYEKALRLPMGQERTAIYKKMRAIVVEEAPWIFGVHRLGYVPSFHWLKNFKPHPIINDDVKYYRVDTKEKAKLKAKL